MTQLDHYVVKLIEENQRLFMRCLDLRCAINYAIGWLKPLEWEGTDIPSLNTEPLRAYLQKALDDTKDLT